MPLRMLVYMARIWERCIETSPDAPLPPIVPLVLCHSADGWSAPTRMHDLVRPVPAHVPGLAELVPQFRIVVDDIGAATDIDLRGRALAAFPMLALWLLRDGRRGDAVVEGLQGWADAFLAAAAAPGGIEALHRLIRYLELVLSEERFERVRGMLKELAPATQEAIMTYSDRVFAEGKAEGKAEGMALGRVEAERDTLLKLLALKFGALDEAVISEVRAADLARLDRWLERVVVATQLAAVFES
jgi:Putative transposase, YhgA-like